MIDAVRRTLGLRRAGHTGTLDPLVALTGRQRQRPPAYSAKKMSGTRAYRLARRGEPVNLPVRDVHVRRFELSERAGSAVDFEAEVSSGTYIRALARDLGEQLGCGAHLEELRRTRVGRYDIADAVPLARLGLHTAVRPALEAVAHLACRELSDDERRAVSHGRALPAGETLDSPVALTRQGRLVAVAERVAETLKPRVVLADA